MRAFFELWKALRALLAREIETKWLVDIFFAGGLSIIVLAVFQRLFPPESLHPIYLGFYPNGQSYPNALMINLGEIALFLSFVCNFPHFMVSYVLLYKKCQRWGLRDLRTISLAFVAPGLLLGILFSSPGQSGPVIFLLQLMNLMVGWHYARQTYGIIVSRYRESRIPLKPGFQQTLDVNLISVAAIAWIYSSRHVPVENYFGFLVPAVHVGELVWWTAIGIFAGTLLVIIFERKSDLLGPRALSFSPAVVAYVAFLAWYLPVFFHPAFFLFVPFFHSIQYLWFVGNHPSGDSTSSHSTRFVFFKQWLFSAALGALLFYLIPGYLDGTWSFDGFSRHSLYYMAVFAVSINLHHYLIDAVIWKSGAPKVPAAGFIRGAAENCDVSTLHNPQFL